MDDKGPIRFAVEDGHAWFWCRGCRSHHIIPVDGSRGWQWNKSLDRPTITPSLRVFHGAKDGIPEKTICHLFVRDGRIEFLSDCEHEFAGKTVAMGAG